ncbi:hypothetical protein [Nocardioides marmorisolisilvae]|uniref:Lipoprotein n=1 Tax=Nocardioides marmorisolisilvae TaxID=1542737 RepID=A0A3N0DZW9_9ACTN|nr:hypothetical protein [Nocardioides marmorisolisilvae]RNL81110.1 hypothetical protein EFL95_01665 [Nocardioides marmorisolisilvae]
MTRVAWMWIAALAIGMSGCSEPSPNVTVTNKTGQTIRLSGNCIQDDAYELDPGESSNDFYLGAQCRVDDGDGSMKGMLGCVTLKTAHTDITPSMLRDPPKPDECWGSGTRH